MNEGVTSKRIKAGLLEGSENESEAGKELKLDPRHRDEASRPDADHHELTG